ncbi:hypothetical protein PIB30_007888 [Stylosanthes scabra]|uniref:Uncharacterized protein n=1 Tax=Stylosanthes scabra TaxID=79078 RepID=A0ABU6R4I7_9FABA|nr:hypothetical protein [Stylosanthes scabra]
MPRLRFLKLHNSSGERSSDVFVPTTLETISEELRYFEWHKYPLSSMRLAFFAEKLIELHMPGSQVTKLWDGVQDLVNLKKIGLSKCKQLVELPDLSRAANLEQIDISYCEALRQLHPSIISIPKLELLELNYCKKLKSFKGEIRSKSLRKLNFNGCSSLEEFSVSSGQLSSLTFRSSGIRSLENELCCLTFLEELVLSNCRELTELPHNAKALSRLQRLTVSDCRSLRSSIPELPSSIRNYVSHCASLETIFSLNSGSDLRKISFLNCMRLDEESRNNIMEGVHLTIFKKILLMSLGLGDGHLWDSAVEIQSQFSCDVCYSGSKLAELFRCRTTEGASIKAKIDEPYDQLLGFYVSCAVSQEFSPYSSVYCEYDLGDGERYPLGTYYLTYYPNELRQRWGTDHICVWFHPFYTSRIKKAIETCVCSDDHGTTWNKTILFTFTAEGCASRVDDFFMKSCGVLPIYASDVLQLIPKLELELKGLHQDLDLDALKSKLIWKISNSSSDQEEEEDEKEEKKERKLPHKRYYCLPPIYAIILIFSVYKLQHTELRKKLPAQ